MEDAEQLLTGSGDAGSNGSDGHAEEICGLVILEPVELGEDEGGAPVVVELVEELVDLRSIGDGSWDDVLVDGELCDPSVESPPP